MALDGKPAHHERIFRQIDVGANALHGEMGGWQSPAITCSVRHSLHRFGSSGLGLGMNKILARQAFKSAGLRTPFGFEIVLKADWRKQPKKTF